MNQTARDEEPAPWAPLPGVDGIWCAERKRSGTVLRSAAVALGNGRLALYSPPRGLGADAQRALTARGAPALLVAPNHFHNLGLHEYATTYPTASLVASSVAIPRLTRVLKGRHPIASAAEPAAEAALPSNVSFLVTPGTTNGELWLSVQTAQGRAWLVGDAFFNILRTPKTPMGLLLRLLGICPGLRIGTSFKWFVRDRAAYRSWLLATLDQQQPVILIPCHGAIVVDPELPRRLRELVEARL